MGLTVRIPPRTQGRIPGELADPGLTVTETHMVSFDLEMTSMSLLLIKRISHRVFDCTRGEINNGVSHGDKRERERVKATHSGISTNKPKHIIFRTITTNPSDSHQTAN